MTRRNVQMVQNLLRERGVVELPEIQEALVGAARATAFRFLAQLPYRRSYNHNGRYYTLHDPDQYDRHGLYGVGDIHFSLDGSLTATVVRLVREAVQGWTQRELQELLRVRVQVVLLEAVRRDEIYRECIERFFVYTHIEPDVRREQLRRRQEQIAAGRAEQEAREISDATIIEVLLVLIRHPGSRAGDVVRRLRGHEPPIPGGQVQAVFDRYDLGQKRGSATC